MPKFRKYPNGTHRPSVRVDTVLWAKVEEHCRANGLSLTDFVQRAIQQRLRNARNKTDDVSGDLDTADSILG